MHFIKKERKKERKKKKERKNHKKTYRQGQKVQGRQLLLSL